MPHRRSGKLIVSTDEKQTDELQRIQARAHANGVTDVVWMTRAQAAALEPEVSCTAALYSPSTGIIDSHALMLAYLGDEDRGAMLALKSRFEKAVAKSRGFVVYAESADPIEARILVIARASRRRASRARSKASTRASPARTLRQGNYYTLTGRSPFSRLVYPVPEPGGLGVHVTLDLAGQARFGPDVEWVQHIDYRVDPQRAARFYAAIRRYWPGLRDGALAPGYAGIRPKTAGPGEPAPDFVVQGPACTASRGS